MTIRGRIGLEKFPPAVGRSCHNRRETICILTESGLYLITDMMLGDN